MQGATAYHLQLSTDANFGSLIIDDSTLSSASYEAQSLAEGGRHYWRVRAENTFGWGPYAGTYSFEVGSLPGALTLVEPADDAADLPATVVLSWVAIQRATAYHLQLSTDANFNSFLVNDSTLSTSTHEVQSLAEGGKYYWRVRGKNAFGWGPYSQTRTFGVASRPIAPSLSEPADGAVDLLTSITFTWAEIKVTTAYHLQLSTDASFISLVVNDSTIADSTHEVESLAEGSTYHWRVRARNSFGWGPYSEIRTFEVQTTSVEEGSNLPNAFALNQNYPNPFNPSTSISYELPKPENVRIIVYDLTGRQVRELVNERKQTGSYTVLWDGNNQQGRLVASGLYVYQIRAGGFSQTLKMLFMK